MNRDEYIFYLDDRKRREFAKEMEAVKKGEKRFSIKTVPRLANFIRFVFEPVQKKEEMKQK